MLCEGFGTLVGWEGSGFFSWFEVESGWWGCGDGGGEEGGGGEVKVERVRGGWVGLGWMGEGGRGGWVRRRR